MLKVINGATPAEIKNGLKVCTPMDESCLNCPYADWSFPNCTFQRNRDAYAYIEQLESAQPKWISVEKRKPKVGEFVLFQYAKNAQNPTMHARNTMAVGRYEYGMFLVEGCSVKVTHWMPLPEAPKT